MNKNRKYSSLAGLAVSRHESVSGAEEEEEDDAFADILYDENKGNSSVQRTLECLKRGYAKHEKALEALMLAQDGHCESMTDAFDEIGQFIERESSLTTKIGRRLLEVSTNSSATSTANKVAFNSITAAPSGVQPQSQYEEQLKNVLCNFKAEIVRQQTSHDKRFEALEQSLAAYRDSIGVIVTNMKSTTNEPVHPTPPQITDAMVESRLEEMKKELHRYCTAELLSQQNKSSGSSSHTDVRNAMEQVQTEMVKDYAKRQAQVLKDVDERNAANYKLFDNLLLIRLDAMEEKFETKNLQAGSRMETLAQSVNALVQNNEAQVREIQLLHQQMEEMRLREKESLKRVDTELYSRVGLLEQQMRLLREQVDNQNMLLEELHVQASFENSFREVRDWVGDLEKRAVNRGEMIEMVGRLDGDIAALREEMALTTLRHIRQPK